VTQDFYKKMAFWIVLLVMLLLIVTVLRQGQPRVTEIAYSEFLEKVQSGEIEKVTIEGSQDGAQVTGTYIDGGNFQTYAPAVTDQLLAELTERQVAFDAKPAEASIWPHLVMWAPFLLIIGMWLFVMRQMQAGGGKAMSFGKSRARLLNETQQRVTFDDVAGVEESKFELEEIIEFLREPKKFTRLGGHIPKGVLLVGPPGTGKTLLARAVAGEAGVPFFSISGSDFVEMFVGVGASRVRDLFLQGKKHAPCIIFIDEIDAVGRHRGAGLGGGHDEREQTLNQLLVEMDGFESNEGVILIAATNRPDVLDPALLRPGRFDRRVVVPRPDLRGRHEILKVHVRRVPLDNDVKLENISRGTPGFVGADLENLVNEAALIGARRDAQRVANRDFEQAKDKVLLGAERRSLIMSEEDKRITAFHEGGHALVGLLTPASDPVHKVTIIPRGMALGVTQMLPAEDRFNLSKKQMIAMILYAMGGRAAEEIVFDEITTGAANDLQKATELARQMICRYGMSEKLGPVTYGDDDHDVFLGRDFMMHKDYSEKKAQEIDDEVTVLLIRLYAEAKQLLEENRDLLERIAEALLERETLDGAELKLIMAGEPLPPLPSPVAPAAQEPTPAKPERTKEFPGENIPDPEPLPS
jgi:cell division protease FtsH